MVESQRDLLYTKNVRGDAFGHLPRTLIGKTWFTFFLVLAEPGQLGHRRQPAWRQDSNPDPGRAQ